MFFGEKCKNSLQKKKKIYDNVQAHFTENKLPLMKSNIVYKPGFQEAYFPVHIEQNIDNLFQFTIAL